MTIKELRAKQLQAVEEARAAFDSISEDTTDARAKELEEQFDRAMAEYDSTEKDIERSERIDRAESIMNRDSVAAPNLMSHTDEVEDDQPDTPTHREAFRSWLCRGSEGMSLDERRVLSQSRVTGDGESRAQGGASGSIGGYTVPEGFMDELIKALAIWGPMLDGTITRVVRTDSGNALPWPTMDDTSNVGALLAENTQDSEQDLAFGVKQLDAYKYTSKIIRVSEELLQDTGLDIEAIIMDAFAERLGRKGNTDLTVADGSSKPNGIVTASALGKTAAAAAAVTFDELIDLEGSVDAAYREDPTTRWQFADATLQAIRKLKDGNSAYIWQPADVRVGAPSTLLGYPYSVNAAMPAMTTGLKSIIFGAHSYYAVRIVNDVVAKRLVERYADYHQVGFVSFIRIDGELLNTAAVKHLIQA